MMKMETDKALSSRIQPLIPLSNERGGEKELTKLLFSSSQCSSNHTVVKKNDEGCKEIKQMRKSKRRTNRKAVGKR